METNERLVDSATKQQILEEYKLIQEKKSKLSRAVREKVTIIAQKYLNSQKLYYNK